MSRPRKNQRIQTNSPFKRLRLDAHLTQEKLAREIGVLKDTAPHIAVSTVRRWEKGQAEPTMTLSQTKKFCQAINQNFDQLPNSLLPKI